MNQYPNYPTNYKVPSVEPWWSALVVALLLVFYGIALGAVLVWCAGVEVAERMLAIAPPIFWVAVLLAILGLSFTIGEIIHIPGASFDVPKH